MNIETTYYSIHELGKRNNQEDSIYPPLGRLGVDGLYIVCDGMGGHEGGEIASAAVCEGISSYVASHPEPTFGREAFARALSAGYDALDAKDNGSVAKMGTTLTFLRFHAGGCLAAHIGDSRIYQIRPSTRQILYVSRDHSLVNDLVLLGELTPEQARVSPQKNIITRVMMPNVERRDKGDIKEITDILPGDYFFLCSDGIVEQMLNEELADILCAPLPDSKKMEVIKEQTADNKDNHSAILVKVLSV